MATSYQTNQVGGRQAYQRFWDAISKITVADVKGIPPDSAQATLNYYFNDGRVVREPTAYSLVSDGGRLKINSSTVLSSVTLWMRRSTQIEDEWAIASNAQAGDQFRDPAAHC